MQEPRLREDVTDSQRHWLPFPHQRGNERASFPNQLIPTRRPLSIGDEGFLRLDNLGDKLRREVGAHAAVGLSQPRFREVQVKC